MARGAHYPLTHVVGLDLFGALSKDHLAALVVDMHRATVGEDVADATLPAAIAARLDILATAGLVPRSVPARFPREVSDLDDATT